MAETSITSPIIIKILAIWDKSGSMSLMGSEPVQAINAFVKQQKELFSDDGSTTFTLFQFSDSDSITCSIDDVVLHNVPEFKDYVPNGMTALYDAIGTAIRHMQTKSNFKDVVCVILTDGEENASHKESQSSIKVLIQEMEMKHNWTFIYLGANQDSFKNGSSVGVTHCANFSTSPGGLLQITREVSDGICRRRSGEEGPILSITSDTGGTGGAGGMEAVVTPVMKRDDAAATSTSIVISPTSPTSPRTPTRAPRFM
jgi:hypothetical protein